MARHNFKCNKCKLKFGFDSDIADINRFKRKLKRGIRCPECDDEWGKPGSNITQELAVKSERRSVEKLRRSNAQASAEAQAMAAEYSQQVGTPEMVSVRRPKGGEQMGNIIRGADVEQVPKSVIDSITYKQGVDPKSVKK